MFLRSLRVDPQLTQRCCQIILFFCFLIKIRKYTLTWLHVNVHPPCLSSAGVFVKPFNTVSPQKILGFESTTIMTDVKIPFRRETFLKTFSYRQFTQEAGFFFLLNPYRNRFRNHLFHLSPPLTIFLSHLSPSMPATDKNVTT